MQEVTETSSPGLKKSRNEVNPSAQTQAMDHTEKKERESNSIMKSKSVVEGDVHIRTNSHDNNKDALAGVQ